MAAEELQHSAWPVKNARKEGVETKNDSHVNLKVAGQDCSVVQFKRHMPLSKLMKAIVHKRVYQ